MNVQDSANNILADLNTESQRGLVGYAGTPQLRLCCFIATTASIRSFLDPHTTAKRSERAQI